MLIKLTPAPTNVPSEERPIVAEPLKLLAVKTPAISASPFTYKLSPTYTSPPVVVIPPAPAVVVIPPI